MAKVSIQIVTWNSMRYIVECMESLMRQTFRDFSVMVIDNGSDDGTVEFIRSQFPTVGVLQNFKNLGFSKANNQGIMLARSKYVLVMNPDVVLSEDYLLNMINFADQHPEAGSFCGKTLKLRSEAIDRNDQTGLRSSIKSDVIDSAGLKIYKSRKVVDRGENQKDKGQYDRTEEIFGISGNCALYSKAALDEVKVNNDYFDQDFFAYKEDIDLAWRLRLYGFNSWYHPDAVSYHHRFLGSQEGGLAAMVKERKKVSQFLRYLSFRNHHLMLIKNDQFTNIMLALPWFLPREIGSLLYAIFFEQFLIKAIFEILTTMNKTLAKRKIIKNHRKASAVEIRKWFK